MQIQLEKTLDVEIVERQLADLWKQTTGDLEPGDDAAVLRARVANLLVFVPNEELLIGIDDMMRDLTAIHPSRVLMIVGDPEAADRDIEMFLTSFCQTDKRSGAKRLCGEEVILKATGRFVSELPSVAVPLLVSDLSTFLWWRGALEPSDKIFGKLLQASDRLVVDSSEFLDPQRELLEINSLFQKKDYRHAGISDINWARLTLWRALLADFYDVTAYQPSLEQIDHVRVDYVSPAQEPATVAPQALLIAGWLASRLGWSLLDKQPTQANHQTLSFGFHDRKNRVITLELHRVDRGERKPGRLVRVELGCNLEPPVSFSVARSPDNRRLLAEAKLGPEIHRGRVLPVRNRSAAQLLSREMEILSNDSTYQEAVTQAAKFISL
jgi:glucose-6-phosphate dehydrogenase assembly protein OpcA